MTIVKCKVNDNCKTNNKQTAITEQKSNHHRKTYNKQIAIAEQKVKYNHKTKLQSPIEPAREQESRRALSLGAKISK